MTQASWRTSAAIWRSTRYSSAPKSSGRVGPPSQPLEELLFFATCKPEEFLQRAVLLLIYLHLL